MLPERLILKSGNPFRVSLPLGERTALADEHSFVMARVGVGDQPV
jgi:hypothetical protein